MSTIHSPLRNIRKFWSCSGLPFQNVRYKESHHLKDRGNKFTGRLGEVGDGFSFKDNFLAFLESDSPNTTKIGVSYGSRRALTRAGVALLKGNSSWPAGVWRAGVWSFNTLLLATNVPILTVRVNHTLRSTASDGVWLGDEAREAATDRVASNVRGAGGSAGVNRTAGVRIARIRLRTLD